ncbi:hypothetical protein N8T08_007161 [Aspergillus melleus]|uniref:Uncharacterized protein n=1 Tax=Aspergillus melleus TaxID=138277 RepID=A0ACC3AY50_9EURO|nr:hypothetical protein N8T08_007161 [Aspergillus melleus]
MDLYKLERHDYATDSSDTLTKDGQQGSSKPHVNALAHAANGYRRTMHIDWNGKIEPKPKPEERPKGPYVYDGLGNSILPRKLLTRKVKEEDDAIPSGQ